MVMPREDHPRMSPIEPLRLETKSNGKNLARYVVTATVEVYVEVQAQDIDQAAERGRREIATRYGRSPDSATVVLMSVEALGSEP